MSRKARLVYVASFALHAAGGVALSSIEVERERPPPVVVELRAIERPKPVPPSTPPPAAVAPEPAPAPAPRPAPAPVAAPAPAAAPAPSYGVNLSNTGPGGGPGGVAVPTGDPGAAVRTSERVLEAATPVADVCPVADTKPKALAVSQPAYTEEARAAEIEGKVRVQLSLDATGAVTDVTVIAGLGYGLDEAAVEAVRGATFAPATHCGAAVASTFTIAIRFAL